MKKMETEEILEALVNKELEPHGLTFKDIKNDKEWYDKLTMTSQQYQEWLDWGIDFIHMNAKNSLFRNKTHCKKEMVMIGLYLGLRIDDSKQ